MNKYDFHQARCDKCEKAIYYFKGYNDAELEYCPACFEEAIK